MPKLLHPNLPQSLLNFVEEVGLANEPPGMPRMAKRIFAYLLICEPETQTLTEIAKALNASKASISTMTRQMCHVGIIEKLGFSGDRREFFKASTSSWSDVFHRQMIQLSQFRKLLEKGALLVKQERGTTSQRLENICQFYLWLEKQLPHLIKDWEKEKTRLRKNK